MVKAFFSDPHIGHANIIKYCNRPFEDVEDMNRTLVANYNRVIGENDTVLWLGDAFFKGDQDHYREILASMHGHKILLLGNHDQGDTAMAALGFELVLREAVMHIAGIKCRLNHFPYKGNPQYEKPDPFADKRPQKNPGEILIHGHSHNIVKVTGPNSISAGVDAWDFKPAMYEEMENLVYFVAQRQNGK